MFKNYFRVAIRNLRKNRLQSFINITGLSVGMAVAVLIGLWIWDEVSFDKANPAAERIAQVKQHLVNNGEVQTWTAVPFPLADALRKDFGADFKRVVLSTGQGRNILAAGEKKLVGSGVYMEPGATALLRLRLLAGSGVQADPTSLLISESLARSFFGDADPLNRVIRIDDRKDGKVTGVYADMPANSSFADLAFVAPWKMFFTASWAEQSSEPWRPNAFTCYVELADNADMKRVSAKISDVKKKNVSKALAAHNPQLFLQPMSEWHLYSEFKNGKNTGGRIGYVRMFGSVGIFVLLLACINFMNLSTARSEKRAKEVGIRKAIGSRRRQLIAQFFGESLLAVFFSFFLALLWAQLSLPFFNEVAGKKLSLPWAEPGFWLIAVCFTAITGLIAGCYPALYLSSFQPVRVLKGSFHVGRLALAPRKVLVVFQFAVSVILIIGTGIVFRQIRFAKDRPVGYTRDGLVAMPMRTPAIHQHFAAVKKELTDAGAITEMAESQSPLTDHYNSTSGLEWRGKDPALGVDFPVVNASFDYGKTVGWRFREGRDFNRAFGTDSTALVLNEAAATFMGLRHPVGETITWNGEPYHVIGLIEDMVMTSPYEPVRPTLYSISSEDGNFVIARINPAIGASAAIARIEPVFRRYNPVQPFEYRFVDDEFAAKFGDEERLGKLAGAFAALAIFICCLGLFGMASFMAEQRVKEIGIRKVLGASELNLWALMSKDFVVLVSIALAIAVPAAWYGMDRWLQNYTYRTSMSWWIFAAAAAGALVITLITVSFQAFSAARANPVKSLRSE